MCDTTNGNQFIESIGFRTDFWWRWVDLAVLVGFCVFFFSVAYLSLNFLVYVILKLWNIFDCSKIFRNEVYSLGSCTSSFGEEGQEEKERSTKEERERVSLKFIH